MKIKFLLLFLVLSAVVSAQTAGHKAVPGTKCSLIPPTGFIPAANFSGFQKEEIGASIVVTELPASLQTITAGFTASALKEKGMLLLDKKTIDFNNTKATFINVSQNANNTTYLKQILIFGDSVKTILVNGIYPAEKKSIEGEVKASLLSAMYNEGQDNDPLNAVKFSIDVSGTTFTLARYLPGSLIYTADGKIPTEKASLIVGNSISPTSATDKKQFCIHRLKQMPRGELNIVKEINPVTINNLEGYEIVASGKSKDDKNALVYQVVLFTNTGDYFIIVGNATEEMEASLTGFKKVARTFKQK